MLHSLPLPSSPALFLSIPLFLTLYTLYHLLKSYTTSRHNTHLAHTLSCLPPHPWRTLDPFFGLDALWADYKALKSHRFLEHMRSRFAGTNDPHHRQKSARTATLRQLNKTFIVTMEPENVKTVLATNFKAWSLSQIRKQAMGEFLGKGIFTTDGEEWRHSREMLRPAFNKGRVGDLEWLEGFVGGLVGCITREGGLEEEDGKEAGAIRMGTVDLQPMFYAFTLDVATEFLFGESADTLARWGNAAGGKKWEEAGRVVSAEEFVDALSYSSEVLEGGGEERGLWGFMKLFFVPNWKLKRAVKVMHRYVKGIVEKGIANHDQYKPEEKSHYVFLHEVIAQTSDRVKIAAELLNTLAAGRDTTASLLSNVWFELSRRPQVWARLQHEIATLDGALPTYEQLKEMKYLNAILKESLRLFPVVPENTREAMEDTVLPLGGGDDEKSPIFVPKGWHVHWSLWSMHRRKDLYGKDAEEFRPERWLDQDDKKGLRVGWEYLPFNGGPRICIGQQFALTEAAYVTVRLMQEFEGIESRDPEPWTEQISLILKGKNGAKVALKPRE